MAANSYPRLLVAGISLILTSAALAGTFGTAVDIGGHASDLALDERRGVVYLSNYTANRIDVVSTADYSIKTSINVAPQPASLALSNDGRFLVIVHYRDGWDGNGITIVDFDANLQRRLALANPPLTVSFGNDGIALVATTKDLQLLDPINAILTPLVTFDKLAATAATLPVPAPTFPPQISRASSNASGDGRFIYGMLEAGGGSLYMVYAYDVASKAASIVNWSSTPPAGPRVVSVSQDGGYMLIGWGMLDRSGTLMAQYPDATGTYEVGGHAIDSARGLVYAQVAATGTSAAAPILTISDADNLYIRERIQLPENLAGKAALSSDGNVLYGISDSGLLVLPVGSLNKAPRIAALQEDVLFRGSFCDQSIKTIEIDIVDPGGGNTPFSLSLNAPGISVSPSSGVTPAKVKITVEPVAFLGSTGTTTASITINSGAAVNVPAPVRVLVNNRDPDQRGSFFNVPGTLVDVLADPVRDRFYVLRQDKFQVLVFDATTYQQIGVLRTGTTPWRMAITLDQRYLLVGNDNSQIANVYDLETLQAVPPIRFPVGHYPRSIAAAGSGILAACRVSGPAHTIDLVDFAARRATEFPALGVYVNSINIDTMLVASPAGANVFAAQADGTMLAYNSAAVTFTAARKDSPALAGAVAALAEDRFFVGDSVVNRSLALVNKLSSSLGTASGFTLLGGWGVRTGSTGAASPGVAERVDVRAVQSFRPTRTSESPNLAPPGGSVFTRTLAGLSNGRTMVSLTASGFTVLTSDYDAALAPPRITGVVNAADGGPGLAPGTLILVSGADMSPLTLATSEVPLPTLLGESCLTVNGIPVPMLSVSSTSITAQLPFNVPGSSAMILKTPGGVSNSYNLTVLPAAPAVFHTGSTGPETGLATVVRVQNNTVVTLSNPIHGEDQIVIYLTGMGRTSPEIGAGTPGPDPAPALVIAPVVTLGGVALPIDFAGLAPGQVGVYQINARVPWWVPTGMSVPLVIDQGGNSTSLDVRVVK